MEMEIENKTLTIEEEEKNEEEIKDIAESKFYLKPYIHKKIENKDLTYFLTCENFDQLYNYLLTFSSDYCVSYLVEAFSQIYDKKNMLNQYFEGDIKKLVFSIFINTKYLSWDDYIGEFYVNLYSYVNPSHLLIGEGSTKDLKSKNKDLIFAILTSICHLKKNGLCNITPSLQKYAFDSWESIDYPFLESYLEVFEIKETIRSKKLKFELDNYKKSKDSRLILLLVKIFDLKHSNMINYYELIENIILIEKERCIEYLLMIIKHADEDKNLITYIIDNLINCRMEKIAAKIINTYKFNPLNYPKVYNSLLNAACLHFYFDHTKGNMSLQNLGELFCKYPECLSLICSKLYKSSKNSECLYLIEKYNLHKDNQMLAMYNNLKKMKLTKFQENIDIFGPVDPNTFCIPSEDHKKIKFIDGLDSDNFNQFCSSIINSKILSLDSEWSPVSTSFIKSKVNILQICNEKMEVFVVDIQALAQNIKFIESMKSTIEDASIIKIGFSFKSEIIMFHSIGLSMFDNMKSFIEISTLFLKSKYYIQNMKISLSEVYKQIFKTGICKVEQLSNWENRPLRKAQLHYAAVDVYILVLIYNLIK